MTGKYPYRFWYRVKVACEQDAHTLVGFPALSFLAHGYRKNIRLHFFDTLTPRAGSYDSPHAHTIDACIAPRARFVR